MEQASVFLPVKCLLITTRSTTDQFSLCLNFWIYMAALAEKVCGFHRTASHCIEDRARSNFMAK